MSQGREERENPTERFPHPEFPAQRQEHPGSESQMDPKPDCGEESYRGSGRLEGKAAVVTGGDSGIGRAVAIAFAREGADVLISHLEEEEGDARETLRLVKEAGRKAVAVAGDIGSEEYCREVVERAVESFGRIDVLVNNAAYQMAREGLAEVPSWQIEHTFRTNVFSVFYLCRAALAHMRPGSSIINTASIEAFHPKPILHDYAASKGAIVTFSKGLALETTPRGIRVNVVAPGPVWTPLIPATMPEGAERPFGESKPIGRPAQPVEISPSYVFLASERESGYISGHVILLTGGEPV
ncbi:SDR family oxidoreductase [Rubrobacter calidifluminis]|uniref:SDR family oxidoreductase n=1 Tax=Rubrobacter calidifluminis TaxID=1392640 RepID=UPI002360F787|nr:SDR family oxidoreductase [Rubrobacter calidifluminis]